MKPPLRGAGGSDFRRSLFDAHAEPPFWTPAALPRVVPLTTQPAELADPDFTAAMPALFAARTGNGEFVMRHPDGELRAHALGDVGVPPVAAVLPFDQLFEHRATAALRLWRAAMGRAPGLEMATLPPARRDRLLLALRALDGRLEEASYRDIAGTLFGDDVVPDQGWKSHDLRDRTVRLVRYGVSMMQGGYRQLLLYPFRRRRQCPRPT
jgi:hypothetical protein